MTRITLPNGNRLAHGQLITKGNAMKIDARNGAAKRQYTPQPTHGAVRQTTGKIHSYLHGQSVDDETADKLSQTGQNVPTHPGMFSHPKSNAGDRLRGTHNPAEGGQVLREAGRLGNTK